jgi:cytosine permease
MNSSLYSSSLNLAAIVRSVPKWKLTSLAGVAGTGVALFGLVDRYVSFLTLLSIVVPPIIGVYTADYLGFRTLYESSRTESLSRFRPLSMVALALGIAIGSVTASAKAAQFGIHLTHLPAIDAFLGSFLSQLILTMLSSRKTRSATHAENAA